MQITVQSQAIGPSPSKPPKQEKPPKRGKAPKKIKPKKNGGFGGFGRRGKKGMEDDFEQPVETLEDGFEGLSSNAAEAEVPYGEDTSELPAEREIETPKAPEMTTGFADLRPADDGLSMEEETPEVAETPERREFTIPSGFGPLPAEDAEDTATGIPTGFEVPGGFDSSDGDESKESHRVDSSAGRRALSFGDESTERAEVLEDDDDEAYRAPESKGMDMSSDNEFSNPTEAEMAESEVSEAPLDLEEDDEEDPFAEEDLSKRKRKKKEKKVKPPKEKKVKPPKEKKVKPPKKAKRNKADDGDNPEDDEYEVVVCDYDYNNGIVSFTAVLLAMCGVCGVASYVVFSLFA